MKFMGSKTELLRGRLGRLVVRETASSSRFVDLFSGSGSVSTFVAERIAVPVVSCDMQRFSSVLSGAIIGRAEPYANNAVLSDWTKEIAEQLNRDARYIDWQSSRWAADTDAVLAARLAAESSAHEDVFTRHYGGHYFSPIQSLELDWLYRSLPTDPDDRIVALAAIIRASSRCAASPGHTAQPFQPTERLLPHIQTAWSRSMIAETQRALEETARRHALVAGEARQCSADVAIDDVREGDTVFCDPPYSDVQYSRFYHVLEGISIGGWPTVSGNGRSPDIDLRARSDFSLKSRSESAMRDMLLALYEQGCQSVIITFPNTAASNGLSAVKIGAAARSTGWKTKKVLVDSTHSTLGGANDGGLRGSRRDLREAVFILHRD